MAMSRPRRLALALCLGALLAGVLADAAAADPSGVTIRRTSHGIPHIVAGDFGGPRLRLRLRARRGQHLHDRRHLRDGARPSARATSGPTGPTDFRGNGVTRNNLNSDFFFQRIIDKGTVEKLLAPAAAARARAARSREAVRGYVAGYNK